MAKRVPGFTYKTIVFISVLLVVTNTGLGIMLAAHSERALTEQMQHRMMDIAASAAALLDGDALESITEADEMTPAYQQALSDLRLFQDNVELSYIYCVREVGDRQFEFTIDPTVADPAEFGESATYTEALGKAAQGAASVDLIPYTDRWGTFYSAYCPVFDSDGNVSCIVGVDFSAQWYDRHIAEINRMVVINCITSLILAVLAVLVATRFIKAEERHVRVLKHANRYDSLTGLAKMGYFFDLANRAREWMIAAHQDPVMLYIDLAGMKFYNQRYGFAEGNKLLKDIAGIMAEHFSHERCGRFGQDHFAAVTNARNLDERLESFIASCAGANEGKSVPVRIGVYPDSLGAVDASTSCDRAKAATMLSRGTYRSVYRYFNEDMLAQLEQRQYVIDNLDRAISEHWIKVYYQPIVRASNGRVCDEEALARWDDPERGMLSPAAFIPALEDAHLIYKLDLNVLEQTLAKMQHLADVGLFVVPASINLSRSDFETCDMVQEVCNRVDASGIPRNMINVEITESAIGRDFSFMKEQVGRFHELGFQVWMDDFGSEYSSLDYLQQLDFDLIKLDMRFMQQFENDEKSRVILTEIIRMAVGLGIDTICEGVEKREQVDFLREIGCSKIQGYYFTPPISMEEVLRRYSEGAAIGFENPEESDYYAALGRVSLYDLSSIAREDDASLRHYFDTLPMAIVETTHEDLLPIRSNAACRQFVEREAWNMAVGVRMTYEELRGIVGPSFIDALHACVQGADRVFVDDRLSDGLALHTFVRRIAQNPVTGRTAVAIAVLSVGNEWL